MGSKVKELSLVLDNDVINAKEIGNYCKVAYAFLENPLSAIRKHLGRFEIGMPVRYIETRDFAFSEEWLLKKTKVREKPVLMVVALKGNQGKKVVVREVRLFIIIDDSADDLSNCPIPVLFNHFI